MVYMHSVPQYARVSFISENRGVFHFLIRPGFPATDTLYTKTTIEPFMQKLFLLPVLLLLFSHLLQAQNPSRITIKGMITDTSGGEVVLPTVMLLNPVDSTLVNFTRGDDKGNFQLKFQLWLM